MGGRREYQQRARCAREAWARRLCHASPVRRRAASLFVAVCGLTLALGGPVHARQAPREVQLSMPHFAYDLGYVATGGVLYLTSHFAVTPRDRDTAPLGRGGEHAHQDGADLASDITVGLVLSLGPILGFVLDGSREGEYARALRVPIVLFESFVMTSGITGTLKNLGVCRPYAWQAGEGVCDAEAGIPSDERDHRRSFPSGHAASSASIAGGLLGMWLLPTGRDDRLAPLALGVTLLSVTTAALRVRAGAHSLVDVGVGFGIGLGVGLGTAALHVRSNEARRVSVSPMGRGLMLHGSF